MAVTDSGARAVGAATRRLREATEPAWPEVEAGVISAVRRTARRSWPVAADVSDLPGSGSGAVLVADQVVRVELARGVALDQACSVQSARLELEGTRLRRVRLGVVAGYGAELHGVAERVRTSTARVLAELLGPGNDVNVDVDVVDLTADDPRAG